MRGVVKTRLLVKLCESFKSLVKLGANKTLLNLKEICKNSLKAQENLLSSSKVLKAQLKASEYQLTIV
jgi:hypothetical protein